MNKINFQKPVFEKVQGYIVEYFKEYLCMPSYAEIGKEFGWASKNYVFKVMEVLKLCEVVVRIEGRKQYTLNPRLYHITINEEKCHDQEESEYWEQKKKYFDKIMNR